MSDEQIAHAPAAVNGSFLTVLRQLLGFLPPHPIGQEVGSHRIIS
jgi:hypothetical protein